MSRVVAGRGVPADPLPQGDQATVADVIAAYRLLLDREPDDGGMLAYRARVTAGLTRRELAEELLTSPEFGRRYSALVNARTADGIEIDLGEFHMVVDPDDWAVGRAILTAHEYEPEVTARVRSILRPGGTFVDAGANIGWYSLLASALVGSGGHVLAIEPNPVNVRWLEASRALNGFENLEVYTGALFDKAMWLALETDASNGLVIPLDELAATSRPVRCSYAVPAMRLDDLLEEHGLIDSVDLLKVDVEGVETNVFAGAPALLGKTRPAVVFEWYPDALLGAGGTVPDAPLDLLRSHGYEISLVDGAGPLSNDGLERARIDSGKPLLDLFATPL